MLKRYERDLRHVGLWRKLGYSVAALASIAGSDWSFLLMKKL